MAPLNLPPPTLFCTEANEIWTKWVLKKKVVKVWGEGKEAIKGSLRRWGGGKVVLGGGGGCNIGFGSLALIGRLLPPVCSAPWLAGLVVGEKRGGFQKRVFGRWGGEGEGERRYIRRQFGWSLPLSPSLPFLGFGRRKQGGVFTNNFDKTFTKTFLKFHSAIFATKSLINF